MQTVNLQVCEKIFAEGAEVGAIAKTPWGDAHELPAWCKQSLDEGNKTSINIARLNANMAQT